MKEKIEWLGCRVTPMAGCVRVQEDGCSFLDILPNEENSGAVIVFLAPNKNGNGFSISSANGPDIGTVQLVSDWQDLKANNFQVVVVAYKVDIVNACLVYRIYPGREVMNRFKLDTEEPLAEIEVPIATC